MFAKIEFLNPKVSQSGEFKWFWSSSDEMDSNGPNGNQNTRHLEVPSNADERCDATLSDELDGWRTSSSSLVDIRSSDEHSDECLTPEMKYRRTQPLQPSLVLESPESNGRTSSAPPRDRRG